MSREVSTGEHIGIPTLRFEFVGMLFALAVAEVAIRFAQTVAKFGTSLTALPAHAHLALAICLLATSWLGWSWSNAAGNIRPIKHPFSVEFAILLTDVVLVICYFVVAHTSELLEPENSYPSARGESLWMAVIFGLYFFWDFLTKAVSPSRYPEKEPASFGARLFGKLFWTRGGLSGVCLIIAMVGAQVVWNVAGIWPVVVADIGLIALVFLFRALKQRFYGISTACFIIVVVSFSLASLLSRQTS